jgi:hypothetical protein
MSAPVVAAARAQRRPLHDLSPASPARPRGPIIGYRGGRPVRLFDSQPAPGRFRDAQPVGQNGKNPSKPAAFPGTKPRASDPYCSKPSVINYRVKKALGHFEAAIAAGHETWLAYTVIVSKLTPLTSTDHEAQQLVVRHLAGLKRWFDRQGEPFEAGWSLERRGRLGLHAHVVMACSPRLAIKAKATVTENLSRLTGEQIRCPALKFHCRRDGIASADQAQGWWNYSIKSAVKDGEIVHGIRGELHRPVAAKPRGWVRGAV